MPNIEPADFTKRGWKEHYSGFPKDLFYTADGANNPWEKTPHLHVNYAISGALQSVTYKSPLGENTYLFINGKWNSSEVLKLHFSPFKSEITYLRGL